MAGNTLSAVQANQTFTTGVVPLVVGVLNPPNTPQFVWDCGVGMTYAIMTTLVTGSPASFTIVLEGTYDGVNYVTLATTTNVAGESTFATGLIPFTNLRARCSAVSGGTNPTVNVFATASQTPIVPNTGGIAPSTPLGTITAATTLSAATTGNGTTIDFGSARHAFTFQITPAGTITAGQVQIQLSLDGVSWSSVPTASLGNVSGAVLANPYVLVTGTTALFTVGSASLACRYARINVSTNVTGAGGSVSAIISAY